jgi:hypothetical protein
MRRMLHALVALQMMTPFYALGADEKVLIELNTIEGAENRCRLNFVVENKSHAAIESMKLDLVGFGTDGAILRRLITEMGPVRPAKTVVRAFIVDLECRQLGAILVNEVAACTPGEPGACLDGLGLSSRIKTLRLYK